MMCSGQYDPFDDLTSRVPWPLTPIQDGFMNYCVREGSGSNRVSLSERPFFLARNERAPNVSAEDEGMAESSRMDKPAENVTKPPKNLSGFCFCLINYCFFNGGFAETLFLSD
jgi:hypothetical protein